MRQDVTIRWNSFFCDHVRMRTFIAGGQYTIRHDANVAVSFRCASKSQSVIQSKHKLFLSNRSSYFWLANADAKRWSLNIWVGSTTFYTQNDERHMKVLKNLEFINWGRFARPMYDHLSQFTAKINEDSSTLSAHLSPIMSQPFFGTMNSCLDPVGNQQ